MADQKATTPPQTPVGTIPPGPHPPDPRAPNPVGPGMTAERLQEDPPDGRESPEEKDQREKKS